MPAKAATTTTKAPSTATAASKFSAVVLKDKIDAMADKYEVKILEMKSELKLTEAQSDEKIAALVQSANETLAKPDIDESKFVITHAIRTAVDRIKAKSVDSKTEKKPPVAVAAAAAVKKPSAEELQKTECDKAMAYDAALRSVVLRNWPEVKANTELPVAEHFGNMTVSGTKTVPVYRDVSGELCVPAALLQLTLAPVWNPRFGLERMADVGGVSVASFAGTYDIMYRAESVACLSKKTTSEFDALTAKYIARIKERVVSAREELLKSTSSTAAAAAKPLLVPAATTLKSSPAKPQVPGPSNPAARAAAIKTAVNADKANAAAEAKASADAKAEADAKAAKAKAAKAKAEADAKAKAETDAKAAKAKAVAVAAAAAKAKAEADAKAAAAAVKKAAEEAKAIAAATAAAAAAAEHKAAENKRKLDEIAAAEDAVRGVQESDEPVLKKSRTGPAAAAAAAVSFSDSKNVITIGGDDAVAVDEEPAADVAVAAAEPVEPVTPVVETTALDAPAPLSETQINDEIKKIGEEDTTAEAAKMKAFAESLFDF